MRKNKTNVLSDLQSDSIEYKDLRSEIHTSLLYKTGFASTLQT